MSDLKQPHEGIVGSDRSDSYLLRVDDGALAHRDALIAMARMLCSATLVGRPAPIVQRIYNRISAPVPGDLVIEVTSMRRRMDTRVRGLGILLASRTEWADTDATWAALRAEDPSLSDTDRPTEFAFYIQYGPASEDICRWCNCEFVTLPINDLALLHG